MNRKSLILVGGGGHCKSVIEAAESAGYSIKGILDLPQYFGNKVLGYEVIGNDNDISKYIEDCDFVVTLGFMKNPNNRIQLHNLIEQAGGRFATIVASTANVSKYATIGEGSVVLHQANINAGAVVGKSVIINSCANIEHDVQIGDFCHISTGAMVNGNSIINRATFVGSQSIISNGLSISNNCIIGAGSFVNKNITVSGLYYGCPVIIDISKDTLMGGVID